MCEVGPFLELSAFVYSSPQNALLLMGCRLGSAVSEPGETRCSSFPVPFPIHSSDGDDSNNDRSYY